jgi:hypothetical protein
MMSSTAVLSVLSMTNNDVALTEHYHLKNLQYTLSNSTGSCLAETETAEHDTFNTTFKQYSIT